jgi:hypothetical protein
MLRFVDATTTNTVDPAYTQAEAFMDDFGARVKKAKAVWPRRCVAALNVGLSSLKTHEWSGM